MASKRRTTITSSDESETKLRSTLSLPDGSKSFRWESAGFENAHAAFTRWADHVRQRPSFIDRRKRNLLFASLYSNLPLLGFGVNTYTRNIPYQGSISLNVTQNAIDSLVSKVCKNRPRPMFTTVEGDYELMEKVENADKYVDGKFHDMSYYTTVYPGKVLDTCIYGLGVTKVHEVDGEPIVERTYPWEMIHDDRECLYGTPVRIGQRKFHDKQEAFDLYRKNGTGKAAVEWNTDLEQVIDSRAGEVDPQDFDRDEASEQIVIYQGWIRPTPRRPGKMISCLRGKTLRFEDTTDDPPFVYLRPEIQSMGFYGIGICERVAGVQREINRLIRDIQLAMHLLAKPHWMVETSSNVNVQALNNDMATIIKYTGAIAPSVYTPQSMSSEVFQHLQFLVRTLFELTGISQANAQSQKPAGISSNIAYRTYLNVETERFGNFVKNAEESASQDALKLAKVIGGLKKPKATLARSGFKGRKIEQVTWSKLDLETIAVQVYATSKLPDTPAGRREYALEMAQYTRVTTDDIFEMLEWDDTEAFARRRLAGKRNVEHDIMKMRKGEKVIRDAIGNHKMAFDMMTDAYEQAVQDNLPEDRLDVMRNYIKACYRYVTGKAWSPTGPNPLDIANVVPQPAPMGVPNAMGGPMPMMPPGAMPPPPQPLPNGGVPMPPPQGLPQ